MAWREEDVRRARLPARRRDVLRDTRDGSRGPGRTGAIPGGAREATYQTDGFHRSDDDRVRIRRGAWACERKGAYKMDRPGRRICVLVACEENPAHPSKASVA